MLFISFLKAKITRGYQKAMPIHLCASYMLRYTLVLNICVKLGLQLPVDGII